MSPHRRHLLQSSILSLGFSHSRLWLYRAIIAGLMLLSLALMLTDYHRPELAHRLRSSITSVFMPVVNVISNPVQSMEAARQWLGDVTSLYAQNSRLRQDNATLTQWQAIAQELQQENLALRRLLRISFAHDMKFRSARVITGTGGAYSGSLMINSGSNQGIGKYQAVVSDAGMVGTIMEVSENRARLLLVTDINARTPVVLEHTRDRAILAGMNNNSMQLLYLQDGSEIQPGDRLVTSGDGDALPPGLPVGVVSAIEDDGSITVRPLVAAGRLDYVRVIDYSEK